jgi:hypothetical protein
VLNSSTEKNKLNAPPDTASPTFDNNSRHDLDPAQLFAWRRQFRERLSPAAALVQVELDHHRRVPHEDNSGDLPPSSERIEVALTNGRRVFASASIEPVVLSRLVAVLDEA